MNVRTGFHEGELAVQERAGVREDARRLVRMLDPAALTAGIAGFLAQRTFAVMTGRDGDGTLWTTPITGEPGFLRAVGPTTLHAGQPDAGSPLRDLPPDQPVGLITVDFARRRRIRLNGTLTDADETGLTIAVEQAYGNCPQYIRPRPVDGPLPIKPSERRHVLTTDDVAQIRGADTFFLGTTHPERGNDASHRGGPAGFVRVLDDHTLEWPDFPGNNMFNSLGNIAVDPTTALLFVDFPTGRVLHLTGRSDLAITGDDRTVRFTIS
ncbi:pyridoxamine 5'-phosphate oxidase family protein [Paractinoplanes maris]|uniref:pyridoxamine 5'-phosphate oxidase family protein n=1 Tax=Paractinoplanes maris TaxID=1734446 RepID=UPI0020207347|nr:pyridoxamine 5'-phosphate oxidase family protein [Actinoplanes maris]